jgi:hypothetical protein
LNLKAHRDFPLTFMAHVELSGGMELTLNLAWALLALWMLGAWLRIAPTAVRERRAQFVALAVVILILLPAISMTDDLLAAQNPAELDCCVRRDYDCFHAHASVPTISAGPAPVFNGLTVGVVQLLPPNLLVAPLAEIPALTSIQNRPPPSA